MSLTCSGLGRLGWAFDSRAHAVHGEDITLSLGCVSWSEELVSSGSRGNERTVCRQRKAVWGSASSCVLQRSALVW